MKPIHSCPVVYDEGFEAEARALAAQLNNQAVTSASLPYLYLGADGLSLHITLDRDVVFQVDFLSAAIENRQRGKKPLIIKACGSNHSVLDLTAGFGRDGFILAHAGFDVTMIECHPIIASLLHDGLVRLKKHQDLNLRLHQAEATEYLLTLKQKPDVIYLDPMFARNARALVKKDLQIIQRLTADMTTPLLHHARHACTDRIVVKRHIHAPFLEDLVPQHQLVGKKIRYDIYKPG